MAEFSGKIVDAYYTNEDYTIVKVLYEDNQGVLCPYHLVVEDNADWEDLKKEGWTHDMLLDSTAEVKKAQAAAFSIQVNNAAKALIAESMPVSAPTTNGNLEKVEDYFNLFVNDDNKDNLFKCKLWALETPYMKVATKEQKSKLRKSKSLLEVFAVLYEIKQTQE